MNQHSRFFRTANESDASEIGRIYVDACHLAYETILNASYHDHLDRGIADGTWEAKYRALIEEQQSRILVAEEIGEIVGFALLTPMSPKRAELEQLFFAPHAMGRGVGSDMHAYLLGVAVEMGVDELELEAVEANARAMRFYRAHGWAEFDRYEHTTAGGDSPTHVRMRRAVR